MSAAVLSTQIEGLPEPHRGKVRDVYSLGEDAILLVATDRLSAFDVVMRQGVPEKGKVLTQLSAFWLKATGELVPNHLISVDDGEVAAALARVGARWSESLAGRSTLCKKTTPLLIEAVVRGYLSGSMWKDYRSGALDAWGVRLPDGLRESDKLPEPLFTPSTKAPKGSHDAPMTPDEGRALLGANYEIVERASQALYRFAGERCAAAGLILADTKFEFGVDERGDVLLIDEALTPDSSRFWPEDSYAPGGPQKSFDKQFVRDFLETVPGWNKQPPPPDLPGEVLEKTAEKYREAFERLTGHLWRVSCR